jgi:biofilm protein TabA
MVKLMVKRFFATRLALLLICPLVTVYTVTAQTAGKDDWDSKKASDWYNQKAWKHNLKQSPHASTDKVAFATQYHKNKEVWDKAFSFMSSQNLDTLSIGKYPIDGDKVFATVTEAPDKEFDNTKWESHRKYIDLQYIIKGKEKIGVAPIDQAAVIKPYDEAKDVANYNSEGKFYIAAPGTFFLFFPTDIHRPSIKVDGYNMVKKLVIKIQVAQ